MPRMLALVGLSGSGKTSVTEELERRGVARKGITATTRPQRENEPADAYDWFTPQEFAAAWDRGEIGESTRYISNPAHQYGITWARLNEAKAATVPTIWIVDPAGVRQLSEIYPSAVVSVFLCAQRERLAYRMRVRGDTGERIAERLARYDDELTAGLLGCQHIIDTTHKGLTQVADEVQALIGGARREEQALKPGGCQAGQGSGRSQAARI